MSSYTPGPWRIGFEDGTGWMDDEDGGWIIGADEEVVVAGGNHDGLKYGVLDEHNGLLIAATPDLLNAAERAYALLRLQAEKRAAQAGSSEVDGFLEPEAVLLQEVLERAVRPEPKKTTPE